MKVKLPPCKICGKRWKKGDIQHYIDTPDGIICIKHPGIANSYRNLVDNRMRQVSDRPKEKATSNMVGELLDNLAKSTGGRL